MSLINIRNLTVSYKNANGWDIVIGDLSLNIEAGERIVFVGESGCGKSTVLKAISDLIGHDENSRLEGRVHVANLTSSQARQKRLFGFAFQDPVLLPWLDVESNVRLPCDIAQGDAQSRCNKSVEGVLNMCGAGSFRRLYPSMLSGGMKQRVNIARALVNNPQVLLLDEPFASLDEITREKLNEELLGIWSRIKPTILLVTHNLLEAAFLADRVIILGGRPAQVARQLTSPIVKEISMEDRWSSVLDYSAEIRQALRD